jgi:hypothetical protein
VLCEKKHDIVAYLDSFARNLKHQDIEKRHWTIKLERYLTGAAQRAFSYLDPDDKDDWDKVVLAIKKPTI